MCFWKQTPVDFLTSVSYQEIFISYDKQNFTKYCQVTITTEYNFALHSFQIQRFSFSGGLTGLPLFDIIVESGSASASVTEMGLESVVSADFLAGKAV